MSAHAHEENKFRGLIDFSKLFSTLRQAIHFALRYEHNNFLLLIFFAALTAIIPLLQFGLLGKVIDASLAYKSGTVELGGIVALILALIASTLAPNVISFFRIFVSANFRFNLMQQLDLYFFKKIGTLDIATVESTEYQELMQKASERGTYGIFNFLELFVENLSLLIAATASLVIIGFIDRLLLVYALLGSLPALYVQLRYGKNVLWVWDLNTNNRRKYFNRRSHFYNKNSLIELSLHQLGTKFLNEIKKIMRSFNDELKSIEQSKLRSDLVALLAFALFFGLGIWRIMQLMFADLLPVGQMIFAYTTFYQTKGSLGGFFKRLGVTAEFATYAGYWFSVDALQPRISNDVRALPVHFAHEPPRIEFKNVSFRYDARGTRYALKDLSFVIEPGAKVAIVGLSGAGKTTLIKLLCRVYDPEKGHILINGTDLRELRLHSWQEQLGVLFQDFSNYEFTVREAIALGNAKVPINDAKVKKAARMARADTFIERLPKKYKQLLWKGFQDGVELSKGERQRMALARVLYREAPITILDEPTASVDALAEQEIFETLERLPNNRTVILISHRFSTVKNADTILVIEEGKLIEQGKHAELMQQGGSYAKLYRIQAESYEVL